VIILDDELKFRNLKLFNHHIKRALDALKRYEEFGGYPGWLLDGHFCRVTSCDRESADTEEVLNDMAKKSDEEMENLTEKAEAKKLRNLRKYSNESQVFFKPKP
jgi:hypothetical protein